MRIIKDIHINFQNNCFVFQNNCYWSKYRAVKCLLLEAADS